MQTSKIKPPVGSRMAAQCLSQLYHRSKVQRQEKQGTSGEEEAKRVLRSMNTKKKKNTSNHLFQVVFLFFLNNCSKGKEQLLSFKYQYEILGSVIYYTSVKENGTKVIKIRYKSFIEIISKYF